jgi:hypothetical protein
MQLNARLTFILLLAADGSRSQIHRSVQLAMEDIRQVLLALQLRLILLVGDRRIRWQV